MLDKRMKIIITESQYKMLLESNTDSMQNLIDMAFDQIKENCEGGYYIRSHQNLICDPVDIIEEIKVVDVSKVTSMDYFEKNKMDVIHIKVNCYVDSIHEYNNLDNFIYELQVEARNIIGGNFITIEIVETINKRKDFNW
jgi:hypothetical protein